MNRFAPRLYIINRRLLFHLRHGKRFFHFQLAPAAYNIFPFSVIAVDSARSIRDMVIVEYYFNGAFTRVTPLDDYIDMNANRPN